MAAPAAVSANPLPASSSAPAQSGASAAPDEFTRLWRGFMTARVTLGLVLLLLQLSLYGLGLIRDTGPVVVCAAYLGATLWTRLLGTPRRLRGSFDPGVVSTVGVDVAAFAALQLMQGYGPFNYAPLLALPVLLASVLGSLLLAMGAAAVVTLLLLGQALTMSFRLSLDPTTLYAQSALTGAGYFVIAFLATQISARLAREELRSHSSQLAVRVQREVNALVIESLSDGILVIDPDGMVWAANPAARRLLGLPLDATTPLDLASEQAWQALRELARQGFATELGQQAGVVLHPPAAGPQRLRVHTRLTPAGDASTERYCVMFLQDQREMEARLRTEKLASMGRMSTAVAHEIRNPLAAIVQANALLDEDLSEPRLRQLTQLVQQNARRLENIVDEVLDISRVQRARDPRGTGMALHPALTQICREWVQHTQSAALLDLALYPGQPQVVFDVEHLRRVLVNLLDNARRHASGEPGCVRVSTWRAHEGQVVMGVWSDGPPMEASVERHLFEPFFSSESRSTGLGLYICRELCEGHGATIGFERGPRVAGRRGADEGGTDEGNRFTVNFAIAAAQPVVG